jgi:uncharacterized protein
MIRLAASISGLTSGRRAELDARRGANGSFAACYHRSVETKTASFNNLMPCSYGTSWAPLCPQPRPRTAAIGDPDPAGRGCLPGTGVLLGQPESSRPQHDCRPTMCANAAIDLLSSPSRQGRATCARAHRPWPMPQRPWIMGQTWTDVLFAHWSVPPEALRAVVPTQLPLDTFEGCAWVGVVPFSVRNLRPRLTLPIPFLSAFPEINVRTYVTVDGRPGVYFFSLDAASSLAVAAARRFYRLPYFRARMRVSHAEDRVEYSSVRLSAPSRQPASFRARYWPLGDTFTAAAGTLDRWLTERYCLYTLDEHGRVLRGEIHHRSWPLQPAAAEIALNTMGAEAGIPLAGAPLLHYARRQDVVFWALEKCPAS